MEQIYFGQRIAALRKSKGMTQEALAQRLGITNQAVSKWESDQCCPDIMQLPALADIFEISMDKLFGRAEPALPENPPQETVTVIGELPWEDNDDLHAVCFIGHRLVRYQDIPSLGGKRERFSYSFSCLGFDKSSQRGNEPVQLHFSGNVGNIYSDYAVYCAESAIGGNASAGGDIDCGGDIGGRVQAGGDVECQGSIQGDLRADGDVSCAGDITGNVTASGDVDCTGSIGGNASAAGDIRCGRIQGSASARGDINMS